MFTINTMLIEIKVYIAIRHTFNHIFTIVLKGSYI